MAARGHGPPAYGGSSSQAPGMMRHGPYPAGRRVEPLPHPELADNKLVAQSAEIERLAGDNHRLAATHVALRQDLVGTQQEVQKLRAHIGSIQTESDIQIRILVDKIAKMEAHIRAGENMKKDLQQAHTEARNLVGTRQQLVDQLHQASQELEMVRADLEKIPEMRVELDGLRKEHQKLRSSFEHEKGLNVEKVGQMELMEKDLVVMAREVEKLRAEVSNAEKRAHVPNMYGGPYTNPEIYPLAPPTMLVSGGYVDGYGKQHHAQMGDGMIPYGGGHVSQAPPPGGNPQWGGPPMMPYGSGGQGGPAPAPPPGGNPQWGRSPYDLPHTRG